MEWPQGLVATLNELDQPEVFVVARILQQPSHAAVNPNAANYRGKSDDGPQVPPIQSLLRRQHGLGKAQ